MFELLVGHDSFLLDPLVAPFSLFTQEVYCYLARTHGYERKLHPNYGNVEVAKQG
jgi:hypothetical protein